MFFLKRIYKNATFQAGPRLRHSDVEIRRKPEEFSHLRHIDPKVKIEFVIYVSTF
jgi:hypothetical protein